MKNVLCYGDSLTWGYDAQSLGRHRLADRWPSALQSQLGEHVHVIAEGLNGRTTAFDDHTADCDRNGARILPTILASHEPLDLIIVMLGTNDLKTMIVNSASSAMSGMDRIISLIKHHDWCYGQEPDILIVAPPKICETADSERAAMFAGAIAQSHMMPTLYADLADQRHCGFFDANNFAKTTPIDGIHMDAENTRNLGRGLASTVKLMLGL